MLTHSTDKGTEISDNPQLNFLFLQLQKSKANKKTLILSCCFFSRQIISNLISPHALILNVDCTSCLE